MQLENTRIIFITIGLIGVLLFASPTISLLVKPPAVQGVSYFSLLDSNHTIPLRSFNIKPDVTYSFYLGVLNQQGSSCYYTSFVKLGNETQSLPNFTLGTPSSLPALYEYKSFISDLATWEAPLTFQVNGLTFTDGTSHLSSITINRIDFSVNKESAWDPDPKNPGYYFDLIVELWIFNSTLGTSQYHNHYVILHLVLNMTQ